MTDRDLRSFAEVAAELLAQADARPQVAMACGLLMTAYRSRVTGLPVLGLGWANWYPTPDELRIVLLKLGWEGARWQKAARKPGEPHWVFVEPPTTAA